MKSSKNTVDFSVNCLLLQLSILLLFSACQTKAPDEGMSAVSCDTVTKIEGAYSCTGECVITGEDGKRTLIKVSGETDQVERYPGSEEGLYQVSIIGGNGFRELEIGTLSGLTLRTATAEVSDGQFPVLEEYVFETDSNCNAVGFTKTVRNPDPVLFKTCVIICRKND